MPSPSTPEPTAWEFAATGTRWRIHHSGGVSERAAGALAAAVEADEARWSRFRPDSEVSALNRRAGEWCGLSPETFELLETCASFHAVSDGAFDPLLGRVLERWGYGRSITERSPYATSTPGAVPLGARMELDPVALAVRLPPDAALDLGGIGKGWIAQRLGRLVTELTDDPAVLIDAGGDLLAVTGRHVIGVEAADDPGGAPRCRVRLTAPQAIATSGDNRRSWRNGDGVRAHHLIDPRTGGPGPSAQATVVAGDAPTADVYAKLLALRPERIATCPHPALVTAGRAERASPGWKELVATPA